MTPFAFRRGPGCPPRIVLERASTGDHADGLAAHLTTCAHCQQQLTELKTFTAEFLAARPTERFVKNLQRGRRPRQLALIGALVAAALAVFLLVPREPEVHFKGSLSSITLKRGETLSALTSGTPLQPGDALRFSVNAPAAGFAVVLERDDSGRVTVVAPFDARAPLAVGEGLTVLPDSAVLDAVKGRERFVTIFSPHAFDLHEVSAQLERDEAVRCEACRVEVSTFDKP